MLRMPLDYGGHITKIARNNAGISYSLEENIMVMRGKRAAILFCFYSMLVAGTALLGTALHSHADTFTNDFNNGWEGSKTFHMIEMLEQNRIGATTTSPHFQTDYDRGHDRAKEVFNALQKMEMQKASDKFSQHGNDVIKNNPDAAAPATVIAISARLWIGQNWVLTQGDDIKLTSHIEGRARSASLQLASSLMNGVLHYETINGIDIGVNHDVTDQSQAEIAYRFRDQILSTHYNYQFYDHFAVSVGASQFARDSIPERNARLLYQLTL